MASESKDSIEVMASVPVSPGLIERAHELVRTHPECFWFRHPEARIRHLEDIRLVVEHLREYGDHRAWLAVQELQKCLSPLFKRRLSHPCFTPKRGKPLRRRHRAQRGGGLSAFLERLRPVPRTGQGGDLGDRRSSQICQSIAATVRSFLAVTLRRKSSISTSDSGGTLCIRKTFAPMVLPAPITVSPPTMVALA